MAENNLFSRLKRLFSTDVVIRNVGGNQLKVIDTDRIQSAGNIETNRRVDRWSRVYQHTPGLSYYQGQLLHSSRIELFRDYEAMDTDSIIASALDIYADECTSRDEFGDVLTIRTQNDKVYKVLRNLFYDILNIEFNMWPWTRNMLKYGDFYLHLNIADKFGVIGVDPISAYSDSVDEKTITFVVYVYFPENINGLNKQMVVTYIDGTTDRLHQDFYDKNGYAEYKVIDNINNMVSKKVESILIRTVVKYKMIDKSYFINFFAAL